MFDYLNVFKYTLAGAQRRFLSAQWRNVALLNYAVDPGLLRPLVPAGTELDLWQGRAYVSLVGFQFLDTKILGLPIPLHRDFEEINLRFYVVRREGSEIRRGVTFIREIVPLAAVAAIARSLYNENYVALPMAHHMDVDGDKMRVGYAWQLGRQWNTMSLSVDGEPSLPGEGSEEKFIAEHYWGYTAQRGGGTLEYRVEHPPWRVWRSSDAAFGGDARELYGLELAAILRQQPASAFLADGSTVSVYRGRKL